MKEFCDLVFLNRIKERKNFDWFLKIKNLKTKKIKKLENEKFEILLIDSGLLNKLEEGKKIFFDLYELKKKKNFLIGISNKLEYKKIRSYLELKKEGNPIIDILFILFIPSRERLRQIFPIDKIIARIVKERIMAIGINLNQILKEIKKNNFQFLSKILNLIWIINKKKLNLCVGSFAKNNKEIIDALDEFHFLLALGVQAQIAKNALRWAKIKLELNKEIFTHKKRDAFIYKKNEKIKLIELLNSLNIR